MNQQKSDKHLQELLDNNVAWSANQNSKDKDFFKRLIKQQNPDYLWIGCSDSRVPANEIVGLEPGELFVHRNVANLVVHTDLNCLSVVQYAVDVLKVKHIIVCGHYGCGGINASINEERHGLVDAWLQHVKDVRDKHETIINAIEHSGNKRARLCELNIVEQVLNLCNTTIVRDAWERNQELTIHGWIYAINDGILRELMPYIEKADDIQPSYSNAIHGLV